MRTWDDLSAEDQAMIRDAARESVGHMRRLWDDFEAAARDTVTAGGGTIVADVDKQSSADALLPLYPTVVESPRLRAMVKRIQIAE